MPIDPHHGLDSAHAYRIQRVARLLRLDAAKVFDDLGVSMSVEQWVLLWRVYERAPCKQRALTDPLFDDRANITRMLDRLAQQGWLTRAPDPDNRRQKLVRLTDDGRAKFEALFDGVMAHRARLFGDIAPEDLAAFERVLSQLEHRARAHGADASSGSR